MSAGLILTTTGRRRDETNYDLPATKMKCLTSTLDDRMAEGHKPGAAIAADLKDLGYDD